MEVLTANEILKRARQATKDLQEQFNSTYLENIKLRTALGKISKRATVWFDEHDMFAEILGLAEDALGPLERADRT